MAFGKTFLRPISNAGAFFKSAMHKIDVESQNQQTQRILVNQYTAAKQNGVASYADIKDAGFRVYSQFEEDGIILYVLSMIGFKTRRLVEIGCGFGEECMSTNLILNHGFQGYLFDGEARNIRSAERFFTSKQDCRLNLPIMRKAWITVETVNDTLRQCGCTGEVDLFSLDIDGNDYWIWRAIDTINPRLLVFETHDIIPSTDSLTIPYDPKFNAWKELDHARDFRSVSLLAMTKLCKARGYRLIGAHRYGFNVFYLRNDEGQDFFPEVSPEAIHDNPHTKWGQQTRWPLVRNFPWVQV